MEQNTQQQHRGLVVATNALAAATVLCGGKIFANEFINNVGATATSTTINAFVHGDTQPYYVNIAADNNIRLDIQKDQLGKVVGGKSTVTTKTNSPFGYQLYVATNDQDNRLYHNNDRSGRSGYFEATTGTATNPLQLNDNQWGYAVAKNANNGNFDNSYTLPNPDITSKWAALPQVDTPALIQTTTQASIEGTSFDVYYAAKTTNETEPGTYMGTIIYTATANSSLNDLVLSRDAGKQGTEITIATPIVTMDENVGTISATIGGRECRDLQTKFENHQLKVVCKVPDLENGNHDVVFKAQKLGRSYTLKSGFRVQ